MMDNITVVNQHQNFQFLSVCHYITTFGIILFNKDLITLQERNQSIPILNALFEYLNKSHNESTRKLKLLHKVLRGSDLYGGDRNDKLDEKYVDETYQYIISSALFFHYGNINGYLAGIISRADNVKYSAFKQNVLNNLSEKFIARDYCSSRNESSKLTPLSIRKIFDDYIWPMFPEPEQDISIIDVDYLYAMVGLKIATSIQGRMANLSFNDYILLTRDIKFQTLENETSQMALTLFSTPALFVYAHEEKKKFEAEDMIKLSDEFWAQAYETLFYHIDTGIKKNIKAATQASLHYKLQKELEVLKSRTFIAFDILKAYCGYSDYAQVSPLYVGLYKTLYHWLAKIFLPSHCHLDILPNLESVYVSQFENVEKTYNEIEKNSIEKVLVDGNLIEKMKNASVVYANPPSYPMRCMYCPPMPRKTNQSIYLIFAIVRDKKPEFYAIRQHENVLLLLERSGNEQEFADALGIDTLQMEISLFQRSLKYVKEDYKVFVKKVADKKTKLYVNSLKMYYKDPTDAEIVLNFIKSLVPFYTCVESISAGNTAEATFSCAFDVISLLPLVGVAAKYSSTVSRTFLTVLGDTYTIPNLVKTGFASRLTIAMNQFLEAAIKTSAKEILTKRFLKDLAIASIRTLDPGFELTYHIGRCGVNVFNKIIQKLFSRLKNNSKLKNLLLSFESISNVVKGDIKLLPDSTGLVPKILKHQNGYEVENYIYPGGSNFFGPQCVSSFGKVAELRSIEGYPFEIPVVPIKSDKNIITYAEYIPKTGKISDIKFEMGENDILRRVGNILDLIAVEGNDVEIIRDYHVYYNTIQWGKTHANQNGNLNQMQPTLPEVVNPHYSRSSSEISRQNSPQPVNPDKPEASRGNVPSKEKGEISAPGSTSFESPGTSKVSVTSGKEVLPENPISPDPHKQMEPKQNLPKLTDDGDYVRLSPPENVLDPDKQIQLEQNLPKVIDDGDYVRLSPPKNVLDPHKQMEPKQNLPKLTDGGDYVRLSPPEKVLDPHKQMKPKQNSPKSTDDGDYVRLSPPENVLDPDKQIQPKQNLPKVTDDVKLASPADNIFKTNYLSEFGQVQYEEYVKLLTKFKQDGISVMREDKKLLKSFKLAVDDIGLRQIDEIPQSVYLWHKQTIKRQNIVEYLINLKDKKKLFFFNDMTLLTSDATSITKQQTNPFFTVVNYHLKFDSQYGIVDLSKFHDNFKNQYIVYPDVMFIVKDAQYVEGKKVLNLEMERVQLTKKDWKKIRHREMQSLMRMEPEQSKRMKDIERAASFISSNVPLCRFSETVKTLKSYILRIDTSTRHVPTYDKMAKDIHNNLKILEEYKKCRIRNGIFIDDVLFDRNLYQISSLEFAKEKINQMFSGIFLQEVETVFNTYWKSPAIRESLRFEDYYVMYSYQKNTMFVDKHQPRRILASTYRLALRQCSEEWNENEITIYHLGMYTEEKYKLFQTAKTIQFPLLKQFSSNRDFEIKRLLSDQRTSSRNNPVLYQLKVKNQAGIADVGRIMETEGGTHFVTPITKIEVNGINEEIIEGKVVLVVKLHAKYVVKERKMIDMVDELNKLYSTSTRFYA